MERGIGHMAESDHFITVITFASLGAEADNGTSGNVDSVNALAIAEHIRYLCFYAKERTKDG